MACSESLNIHTSTPPAQFQNMRGKSVIGESARLTDPQKATSPPPRHNRHLRLADRTRNRNPHESEPDNAANCEADNELCSNRDEPALCLANNLYTRIINCGDPGCSCVSSDSISRINTVDFGLCGALKHKRDFDKAGVLVMRDEECFCNSISVSTECCSRGAAVNGMIFV